MAGARYVAVRAARVGSSPDLAARDATVHRGPGTDDAPGGDGIGQQALAVVRRADRPGGRRAFYPFLRIEWQTIRRRRLAPRRRYRCACSALARATGFLTRA